MNTLRVLDGVVLDESIRRVEIHAHQPYVSTTFGNNDEIRIPIQQQDLYVVPHESWIYVEGAFTKGEDGALTNNAISYLFDELRYEINGVEVDRVKNVGITSTLKMVVSLTESEMKALENAMCTSSGDKIADVGNFSACLPLKLLLGFAEDYAKLVMNVRHELVLTRSKNDTNAFTGGATTAINLTKVQWMVPYVYPSDLERLRLLKIVETDHPLTMCFRSWELYEYPLLPQTTKQTWPVKTTTQLEKPRYVIVAFQTDRKSQLNKDASKFDHCNLTNIKLYLNSDCYPYDNLNLNFTTNKYALLYGMYEKFQNSYYGKLNEPLYGVKKFKEQAPVVVIDASKQMETLKSGPVDVRLEFESSANFPANTTAYCLILHDRVVEYTPSNGNVKKVV